MDTYVSTATAYSSNVRIPEDGDLRNATIIAAGLEDLADQTKVLSDRAVGVKGYHELHPNIFAPALNSITYWGPTINPIPFMVGSSGSMSTSLSVACWIPLTPHVPLWGKIHEIGWSMQGASGHTYMPDVLPQVMIVSMLRGSTTGTAIQVAGCGVGDSTLTIAEYETARTWGRSLDVSERINLTQGAVYWMIVQNESGLNSVGGFRFFDAWVVVGA